MFISGRQILLIHPQESEVPPVLRSLGLRVSVAHDGEMAREMAGREEFDMALVDADLPGEGAAGVVSRLRRDTAIPSILIMADPAGVRRVIRALGEGADDYLVKPLERPEVEARVGRILTWQHLDDRSIDLQKELTRKYLLGNLVCHSAGMRRVRDQILQVAGTRSTVLVLGESGVGKELVAKAIHFNSPRRDAPFIAINCAAIPTTLIETELFGHERGAFTGAIARHKGKFELADGGTIFLDEVGEMDLGTQVKLLRVLEERALMRVGGGREIGVDVRVLAATNGDLDDFIARRRFREDLYFRLKVITIYVPPLRDRREDMPDLARTFLDQIRRENGFKPMRLTGQAIHALRRYSWPGNVRELKNVLESTAITHPGATIRAAHLPAVVRGETRAGPRRAPPGDVATLEEMERDLIRRTLARHAGNRTHAARTLRIGLRTLQRKIKSYGLVMPSARGRRPSRSQRSTDTPSPGLPKSGRT
jgi:DNA-binding NtrC family response regulator